MENTILAIEIGISILITFILGWYAKSMIQDKLEAYENDMMMSNNMN